MKLTTTTALLCLVFCTSTIFASPIYKRDVYVPPVISPAEGEIWMIGEKRLVTWNVKQHPTQITNKRGKVQLRKGNSTLEDINLGDGTDDFDILQGWIEVLVPKVIPGDDYRIVLFGDSGNWSSPFSIQEENNCDDNFSEASPPPVSSIFPIFESLLLGLSRWTTRSSIIIEQL